jgi:hypothetical protein
MAYNFRTDTTGDGVSLGKARFVDLLNDYRTSNGVAEVRFSTRLGAPGNRHAQDAEANGYNGNADTVYGGQDGDTLCGNAGDGDRLALNDLGYSVSADGSGNAVLTFSGGTVTLAGVASSSLEAGWFV